MNKYNIATYGWAYTGCIQITAGTLMGAGVCLVINLNFSQLRSTAAKSDTILFSVICFVTPFRICL